MEKAQKHHRCGLYARVSTDLQAAQKDGSLDMQLNRMKSELAHRNLIPDAKKIYEVIDVYREEGVSAKTLNRPELNRLKEDVIDGRIDAIVFTKVDRLSRSFSDFFKLADFFDKHGILVWCLDDEFDTSTPTGRAILKIMLVFAELEREQTAERTRNHMRERAMKGLHNGGRIWGYDLDSEKKGYLIVNPEQAAEINLMFEKYLELGSTDAVLKYLHQNGIVSPKYESRRGNSNGGTSVHKQTLINILRNPRYIGKLLHNDQLYEGQHQPIISKELFDEVQRRLDNYAQVRGPRKTRSEKPSHIYLLRGMIRCGQCDSMMTPKPGKGYPYYVCTRVTNSAATRCNTPHLPAVAIEDHVVDRMRQLAIDPEEVKRLLADAAGREGADLQKKRLQVKRLAKVIAEKKKEMAPWQQKILSVGPEALQQPWYEPVQKLHDDITQHSEEHNRALAELKDLEERQTSEEIVLEAYRRLGDLINTDNREAMAKILPLVIETLVWTPTPDPDKPGKYIGGIYKMALFDNPLFPKDKDGNVLTADDLSSSQGQNWLPQGIIFRTSKNKLHSLGRGNRQHLVQVLSYLQAEMRSPSVDTLTLFAGVRTFFQNKAMVVPANG